MISFVKYVKEKGLKHSFEVIYRYKIDKIIEKILRLFLKNKPPENVIIIAPTVTKDYIFPSMAGQIQKALGFYRERTETKIAPLCSGARNKKRYDFCNEKRQTHKPHKYLARDESLVQRCKCKSTKGVSA